MIRNKPIMIYLHANTEEYDPADCTSLLVNLGSLEGFHDVRPHPNAPPIERCSERSVRWQLLDDCTARMKMHTFAGKLFTPSGDQIQGERPA